MTKDIRQARAEADAARARLQDTIGALRYRTTPKVIARDVSAAAYVRARHAVVTGESLMRARPWLPWVVGAAIGGITALRFTRRRPHGTARPNVETPKFATSDTDES